MPYEVPSFTQLRDAYLQAVRNQNPAAATGPDSDHFVRACAVAAIGESLLSHQAWVFRQGFPDLADVDSMERMANLRGVTRRPAAAAGGTVRISGVVGTAVASGQTFVTAQGAQYQTTAAGVVGAGGTVDLTCVASVAGAAGNLSANTPVTLNTPPAGLTVAATVLTMTGGSDVEADSALLQRLLLELREPAQGGNAADYQRWALTVPGVARAFVFPARRGTGTVDVVPMPSTGLPGAPLLASVQAVLDQRRPVGMLPGTGVQALAPTAVVQPVTAALTLTAGTTLASVNATVTAAITAEFAALGPGDTLVRNRLIRALLSAPGVTDVTLTAPAANVACSVSPTALELITLGAITLT